MVLDCSECCECTCPCDDCTIEGCTSCCPAMGGNCERLQEQEALAVDAEIDRMKEERAGIW